MTDFEKLILSKFEEFYAKEIQYYTDYVKNLEESIRKLQKENYRLMSKLAPKIDIPPQKTTLSPFSHYSNAREFIWKMESIQITHFYDYDIPDYEIIRDLSRIKRFCYRKALKLFRKNFDESWNGIITQLKWSSKS